MNRAVAALLPILATFALGAWPATGQSADWALSPREVERVEAGAVIAEGDVATDRAAADIRAAIRISAPPEQVFRTLIDCARALRFVPHLKRCKVLETAPDGRWQNVEQQVDYGWLARRASYVFHAEYEKYTRIRFSNLRGDFHENRGVWTFRPLDGGRATVVTYEARVAPAFYVPRWMMRNMLKRDLPDLMRGLRTHAEAVRPAAATNASAATGNRRRRPASARPLTSLSCWICAQEARAARCRASKRRFCSIDQVLRRFKDEHAAICELS